jgi:hypothetical protein
MRRATSTLAMDSRRCAVARRAIALRVALMGLLVTQECLVKYDSVVFDGFCAAFACLPLAHVIDDEVALRSPPRGCGASE